MKNIVRWKDRQKEYEHDTVACNNVCHVIILLRMLLASSVIDVNVFGFRMDFTCVCVRVSVYLHRQIGSIFMTHTHKHKTHENWGYYVAGYMLQAHSPDNYQSILIGCVDALERKKKWKYAIRCVNKCF